MDHEDDTFNKLKRIPYDEIYKIIEICMNRRWVDGFGYGRETELINSIDEKIKSTGWTYDSFNTETTRRAYKSAGLK